MKLEINIEMSEQESLTYFSFMKETMQSLVSNQSSASSHVHQISDVPVKSNVVKEQAKQSVENETDSGHYQPTERELKAAKEGETVFAYFVEEWSKNFGIENTVQPDRAALLNKVCNASSLQIINFIKLSGGLTNSVIRVSNPQEGYESQTHFIKHCRRIAENIAQVSSILFPPIAEFLEYPFQIQ